MPMIPYQLHEVTIRPEFKVSGSVDAQGNVCMRVLIPTPAPMPTATRARHYPGEDRSPLTDPRTEAVRLIALL